MGLCALSTNAVYRNSALLHSALDEVNRAHARSKRSTRFSGNYDLLQERSPLEKLYSSMDLDEIVTRLLTAFVEEVVIIVTNSPDTFRETEAVVALESLTGMTFVDYPPFDDVAQWWSNSSMTNAMYRSARPEIARGTAFLREGHTNEAFQVLSNVAAKCEGLAICHRLLGDILVARNDLHAAELEYLKAITQADEQAEAAASYAAVLLKQKKKVEALAALKKIVDEDVMRAAQIKGDARFTEIHEDPAFKRIIDED